MLAAGNPKSEQNNTSKRLTKNDRCANYLCAPSHTDQDRRAAENSYQCTKQASKLRSVASGRLLGDRKQENRNSRDIVIPKSKNAELTLQIMWETPGSF
jgi:hypothetical protein